MSQCCGGNRCQNVFDHLLEALNSATELTPNCLEKATWASGAASFSS